MADDKLSNSPLFSLGGEWRYNACVNFPDVQRRRYDLYAQGYKKAVDILVEHVRDFGRSQDTLVYPIVFLSRQYLELKFKYLMMQLSTLLGTQPVRRKGHNLTWLWDACAALMREADLDGIDGLIEAVKDYIAELEEADPRSQSFRYPDEVDGNPSLPGIAYIDIKSFYERTSAIQELLEALDSYIQAAIGTKQELDAAMGMAPGTNGL